MSEKLDAMFGADAADYIRQLQAQLAEVAAFLDGLANRCDLPPTSITQIAFDCREMAKRLRGKA